VLQFVAVRLVCGEEMHSREVSSLGTALREFLRKGSPWVIGAGVLALVVLRGAIGDVTWRDAVAVAAMLAIYPFGEWAIHVYLLHAKPVRIRGRRFETVAARAHRAHHRDPTDLDMVLLYWWQAAFLMLVAVPLTVALGALIVTLAAGSVPLGALVSAAIAGYFMVFVYEWTHFLIHTAYRPRSRAYKTIWRNHRLHHFKNEHFWHGITNNLSDRVLGTNPEAREVPKSETARTLDPGATV
jgi:Fatty acid hydroxylase